MRRRLPINGMRFDLAPRARKRKVCSFSGFSVCEWLVLGVQVIAIPALGARSMKMKLAIALAVLFFASQAHADSGPAQIDDGIYIPAGSTVTSNTFYSESDEWIVDFSFAGGTGSAWGNGDEGFAGNLLFTTPVEDVTFSWVGEPFTATDNIGDDFITYDGPTGTTTFDGPGITEIRWTSGDLSAGGITSIDPASDSQSVPEPSSLLLSGIGLAALIGLKLKA